MNLALLGFPLEDGVRNITVNREAIQKVLISMGKVVIFKFTAQEHYKSWNRPEESVFRVSELLRKAYTSTDLSM